MCTQAFSKWVLVLEYEWNKEYIVQTLCINKQKPQLHCNGKCQLAKKIAAEEKDNASSQQNTKSKFVELPAVSTTIDIGVGVFINDFITSAGSRTILFSKDMTTSLLRPPIV
jgi:hypothetical protein